MSVVLDECSHPKTHSPTQIRPKEIRPKVFFVSHGSQKILRSNLIYVVYTVHSFGLIM